MLEESKALLEKNHKEAEVGKELNNAEMKEKVEEYMHDRVSQVYTQEMTARTVNTARGSVAQPTNRNLDNENKSN